MWDVIPTISQSSRLSVRMILRRRCRTRGCDSPPTLSTISMATSCEDGPGWADEEDAAMLPPSNLIRIQYDCLVRAPPLATCSRKEV